MRFIRKIERYLPKEYKSQNFYFYQKVENTSILKEVGFTVPFINGELIVPRVNYNKATEINSNGKEFTRRDLPKDHYYVYHDFEAPNFGDSTKGTHQVTFERKIEKYKREFSTPYSLTLTLKIEDNNYYVCSEMVEYDQNDNDSLTLLFNIFRSIFNVAPMFSTNLDFTNIIIIRKKEWEFLKHGTREEKVQHLMNFVKTRKSNEREAIFQRIAYITSYSTDNIITIGKNGFEGYFCVKTEKFYVFECIYTNNATYIVNPDFDWEKVSQLTKSQVIKQNLADRIYHTINWNDNIKKYVENL